MPMASRERTILFAGFLSIIVLMALLVFVGFRQMQLEAATHTANVRGFEKIRAVYQMRDVLRKRSLSMVRASTLDDFFDRDAERQLFNSYAAEYVVVFNNFSELGMVAEEKAIFEEMGRMVRAQQPKTERVMAALVEDPKDAAALADLPVALRGQTELHEMLSWVISHQEFLAQQRDEKATRLQGNARAVFLMASGLVLIISFLIAVYVTRRESESREMLVRENDQRQQAEEKVRELNRNLESRVKERTRDLEEEIIERRRVETQLRDSETRSRTIVNAAAAGIISISETGIIESFNPAAEDMFGMDADDVIGTNVSRLMPDPDKSRHDAYLKTYMETGEGRIIGIGREVEGQKADGHIFPAYLSIGSFEMDGARKFVGMIEDISAQKYAEQQILHAKEEAELANQAKSDFLANMSHELRTPLNAVIGYSEAMKMEMFGPLGHAKYKEYMSNIMHSGRHLLDLVNDILDISAIEAGRMELHEEVFDLSGLVRETIEHLRGWAAREKVELVMERSGQGMWLRADRRRIRQILMNLLSNAIKFTPHAGTVTVALDVTADGDGRISVSDTGVGIAAKDIPKAFSAFQQIGRGTVAQHEGTGLGLPLSQSFAHLHGGSLHMESTLGVGTTVQLILPAGRLENTQPSREGLSV